MIKLLAFNKRQFSTREHVIIPTIFPDGTSQVWKIPNEMLWQSEYKIIWNFEAEREIIDLLSLRELLPNQANIHLHIPYLPFGRQDKEISNNSTFNLEIFANLINSASFNKVSSVDVHNVERCNFLIGNFQNIDVINIHQDLIKKFEPDYLVFPDGGAAERYKSSGQYSKCKDIFCEKVRDQTTGEITYFKLPDILKPSPKKVLIIDDICDRGRTFIETAKAVRNDTPMCHIGLFVTHGIFSHENGVKHLLNNGIDEVFTTNSLVKNITTHYEV